MLSTSPTIATVDPIARPVEKTAKVRLILVAMRLFAESGFEGVTVRRIATEAGVTAGLIKHHFESKEGLRDAVDDYFLKRTSGAIKNAQTLSEELDADNIGDYERTWIVKYANEWPDFLAYLRRAILDRSPWGMKLVRRYYESIRMIFDRHDLKGHIRPDVDRVWLPLMYTFLLLGPLVFDDQIKDMLGRSTYEPDMWARFQKAVHVMVWQGAGISTKAD